MTPDEHLDLIATHIRRLLSLADKRTPGEWKWHWRKCDELSPASIYAQKYEGQAKAVAMCPRYGIEQFPNDAAFIAATSGNFERSLRSTLAAIEGLRFLVANERMWHGSVDEDRSVAFTSLEKIRAEWPVECLK